MTHAPDQPLVGHVVLGAHHFPIRIYYEDTDAAGVVYHANYLRFFERARWEMLAACGADLLAAVREGEGLYVVAEVTLRYLQPAHLGDVLTIVSRPVQIGSSTCVVQQQVMRNGVLVADGRIRLAFVAPGGKPKRQPAAWIEAFRAMMGTESIE